jgi:hypothetical protein
VSYVADMATRRAFALGGVLHSRRIATAVRRVVLLVVVRPVVEHASTSWCTTDGCPAAAPGASADKGAVENTAAPVCSVADDVLRMELGCRPYVSWTDQRKLELAFRLATMAADSLPAHVAAAGCPRTARKGLPSMHAGVVASLEHALTAAELPRVAAAADTSRTSFKRTASGAVKRDVWEMRRKARSTAVGWPPLITCVCWATRVSTLTTCRGTWRAR